MTRQWTRRGWRKKGAIFTRLNNPFPDWMREIVIRVFEYPKPGFEKYSVFQGDACLGGNYELEKAIDLAEMEILSQLQIIQQSAQEINDGLKQCREGTPN